MDITEDVHSTLYYGHFFCHVFHQDYLVKRGASIESVKVRLMQLYESRGAKYPAEHNVGHVYKADEDLASFYQSIDPTNSFNPGIGKMSKAYRFGLASIAEDAQAQSDTRG